MPQSILMGILKRSEADDYGDTSLLTMRYDNFLETLKSNKFIELICLPAVDLVKNGCVEVSSSHILKKGGIRYIKEELGVIITNHLEPPVVLAVTENNMIAAFWDSLKNTVGEETEKNSQKAETISKLKEYIQKLKKD